jgi:hypothetical protein
MTLLRTALGIGTLALATAAGAQSWSPGSEITGQSVQVETNGVVNTVTFNPDGTANVLTPGGRAVPATWSATNNQLCVSAAGAQECFPYSQAFQAGQPITATSSCGATSRLLASSVNAPPPPPAPSAERG